MEINPAEDWHSLTEHYRAMLDGELEELAESIGDLTETAQQVLRNEMRNRGLGDPESTRSAPALQSAPKEPPQAPLTLRNAPWAGDPVDIAFGAFGARAPELVRGTRDTGDEADAPRDYTWKTQLCECETTDEANQIREMLRRAGIDSWVEKPGSRWAVFRPRVVVAADQLEQAIEIARHPFPPDIIEQSKVEMPEFEAPKCPKCGTEDPVLESAEPTNSWLCEACGKQWTEPISDGEEESAKSNR
ncbi:MAG: hypothetical protein ACLPY1_15915 [Terracidiphilus sp.]